MKISSLITALLFASIAGLSVGAHAADAEQPAAKPAEMQMKKEVKPHSHVEEKTGVPQAMPKEEKAKPSPYSDKTRHIHPRDMK